MMKNRFINWRCVFGFVTMLFFNINYVDARTDTPDESQSTKVAGINQQVKTITGIVVDSDGEPIVGANVIIIGAQTGVITNLEGKFSLSVTEKDKLRITYIGYIGKTVDVGRQTQLRITLIEDVTVLGEVEITAEFGMKRVARAVGSSVQNVKAADILDSGRDNFISALQGRVSGMTVTNTSGAPGASTNVVLRSATSISGNNQPLYVIDGIPMNNSTFDPLAFADASETLTVRNLDFASRGNDLNPEDIAEMTILKGAAAAALYGSDASNGAIIITTKKGSPGKGRVTYSNSFKWAKAYGWPEQQNKYSQGYYNTTNYFNTSRYGGLLAEGTPNYDNVKAIMQTGYTERHNIAVEAGTDKITLRAAASFLDDEGVVKTTAYGRDNLTLSGKAEITKWVNFEASMQYTSTTNNKTLRGTDGPLYRAYRWPQVDDMSNYLAEDGIHMRYPDFYTDTDLLNPVFALNKNKFYDESDRFLSNAAVTIKPVKEVFFRAQIGWDVGSQTFETSTHPYYYSGNNGIGRYNISQSNFSDKTINILASYSNSFFNKQLTLNAQIGYHQLENGVKRVSTYGTNYMVADFISINNCDPTSISAKKRTTKRRIQAISAQAEFGYNNLAFLTFRARNDWSSTLPKDNNSYFYPAIEGSFILTELPFLKKNTTVSFLKIRGSVAQVGKDAGPQEIDPELETTGMPGGGYKYGYTGPNKDLRPEMTTSWEVGTEGRFLNDRIVADFTFFHTHCSDQIVKGFRLSYATGFVLNNMNVGTFNTWGWEGHIDGDIINSNKLRWNVGLNLSKTKSKVVSLPENVSEYYNAHTWASGNIRNGIMVGSPITTLTGLAYQRNDNGDVLISPTTGLPLVDSEWSIVGDREPKIRFGITTSLNYKDFRLSAMFAGRYGATVVNGTKRDMMSTGTSWESVKLREQDPVVFKGVLKDGNENSDNPTVNTISVTYKAYGTTVFTGYDEDWLEKNVNYLRLQELRLSYNVPTKYLKKMFNGLISNATLYATGNDLATWTNYSGIDAVGNTVSAAAGGVGGEGYDLWSLPNPRSIGFGISITFK